MLNYIIKRLFSMIPLLLGVITISFFVIHLTPGKPTTQEEAMNPRFSLEARQRIEELYGLNKPIHVQYFQWLKRFLRLDFGNSFIDGRNVINKIMERLPLTLFINITSLVLVLSAGILLGVISADKEGSLTDKIITLSVFLCFAAPGFWLGLLLLDFFGVKLRLLPISGLKSLDWEYYPYWLKVIDMAKHLILPIFVSSISGLAAVSRYMRNNLIEILKQPFIRAAKAKGLSKRGIIYKHALPNAMLPIITILGLSIPALLGGSVIFESIFALPGVGRLFYEAVMSRDYPMIMAELVLVSILTLLGNLMADISYVYVDPRIRYKKVE